MLSFGEMICHLRLIVNNLHKVGKTSIHAIVSFVTGITAVSQTYTGNEYLPVIFVMCDYESTTRKPNSAVISHLGFSIKP